MPPERANKKVWFHVDMDGLDAICRAQGVQQPAGPNTFYGSAVDNALAFFESEGIRATFFVIATDLADAEKRAAVERVREAGHFLACHGYDHLLLNRSTAAEKHREIFDARKRIEDLLAVPCRGFRAPGYSIDEESLDMMQEAGYLYDSSVFPNYHFKKRLATERLFSEPFPLSDRGNFFEVPLPYLFPKLPPFHPCYAFYATRLYSDLSLAAFRRRCDYLTLLFHLTDFSEKQPLRAGPKLSFFSNNFFSARTKLRFLTWLMQPIRKGWNFTTTEEFLSALPESAPELQPRVILGVSTTHETGACIVEDGEVLAAVNEERFTRKKQDSSFPPVHSIKEVLRIAGIAPEKVGAVAVSGLRWQDLLSQTWAGFRADVREFHAWNDYFPHFCRVLYRLFYFWRATRYSTLKKFLLKEYGIAPKIYFVEHHWAHAASAFFTGLSDTALVVTADGVGDDLSVTISVGRGSSLRRRAWSFYPHSFGQFYTACTQLLGFRGGRHEGKITGLSGYGTANNELQKKIERTLVAGNGFKLNKRYYSEGFIRGLRFSKYRNYKPPLRRLLRGYSREDIAYAFQAILEREMTRLVSSHMNGGPVHLSLAGGVFANVKLNSHLSETLKSQSVYIFPNMGDGGLCVGAALSVGVQRPRTISTLYLGTTYNENEIREALRIYPTLPFTRPENITLSAAQALADRKIIARFDGAMEFGPRALGNRSILYHCGDPTVNQWLNQKLERTEFMPFAPMAPYEDAELYFQIRQGEKRACEFMTLVVKCTDRMISKCPAAVHVDGTARPQLLKRDANPGMHDILKAYHELSGESCVVNTSFNMHEEPIVRSPQEALQAFQKSQLDHLILGPYWVSRAS